MVNNLEIISLGGMSGCIIAEKLRLLGYRAYPYDWIIATQSFVIDSFLNFDNFFNFDNEYVKEGIYLTHKDRKALILHDFTNFDNEKGSVIEKYHRRFNRIKESINNFKNILLIRLMEDDYYTPNRHFDREIEDISKWNDFLVNIQNKYSNTTFHLLLLTNDDIYHNKKNEYKNLHISRYDRDPTKLSILILKYKNLLSC